MMSKKSASALGAHLGALKSEVADAALQAQAASIITCWKHGRDMLSEVHRMNSCAVILEDTRGTQEE